MSGYMTKCRVIYTAVYGCIALGMLGVFYGDAYFCNPSRQLRQIITLFVAVMFFELLGGLSSFILSRFLNGERTLSVICGGVVSGLLVSVLPNYLFLGYGRYRLEGTWGDMSCLFEESQGMVFMVLGGAFFRHSHDTLQMVDIKACSFKTKS